MDDLSRSNDPLGDTITLSLSLIQRSVLSSIKTVIWDEVEDKTQESTFGNLGELLCPRPPPPNGMEDLTPTSLLMRKLAIFFIS